MVTNIQFLTVACRTVTLKKLRAMLEEDLNVEKDSLKAHKTTIAEYVDKVSMVLV